MRTSTNNIFLSACFSLLVAGCGGMPELQDPAPTTKCSEYTTLGGGDVLAQAPVEMIEESLPGCTSLPARAIDPDAVLMRYPGSRSLVVVVHDGAPICVDTRAAAMTYVGRAKPAQSTQVRDQVRPLGDRGDDPVPVGPPEDTDPAGDDPVPVTPSDGKETPNDPLEGGTDPIGDDPVPVRPDTGQSSATSTEAPRDDLSDSPTAPDDELDDDPTPIDPQLIDSPSY